MTKEYYLRDIIEEFDGHIERSPRKFRRVLRRTDEWYVDPKYATASDFDSYRMQVEEIGGVSISIPDDRVQDFVEYMSRRYNSVEYKIRQRVPAVQKAYENYRMLLQLCGGEELNARH